MNFSEYKSDFDRDGFVALRGFLSGEDFTELCDNLDRYIREVVPNLPDEEGSQRHLAAVRKQHESMGLEVGKPNEI